MVARVAVLHLRPAGQPRPHQVSQVVEGELVAQLGDVPRLLRAGPDDREVALQDVDHLRQLVQMSPTQQAPERGDARIVAGGPLARQLLGPLGLRRCRRTAVRAPTHGAELVDRERRPTLADTGLAEHQRPPVRDQIADDHDRSRDHEGQASGRPDHDVHDAFQAAVAGAVHLADVEEQRGPFQLAQRQLAEPLLVEGLQRADPHTGLVQLRRLGDDAVLGLRVPVQDDHRRTEFTLQVEQRRAARLVADRLVRVHRGHQRRATFRFQSQVVDQAFAFRG